VGKSAKPFQLTHLINGFNKDNPNLPNHLQRELVSTIKANCGGDGNMSFIIIHCGHVHRLLLDYIVGRSRISRIPSPFSIWRDFTRTLCLWLETRLMLCTFGIACTRLA
jgi:hypothetical protein